MHSLFVAYLLGILSFIPPFNGLVKFYLGKKGLGFLYTFTCGLIFVGNILDLANMPRLVREANLEYEYRQGIRGPGTGRPAEIPEALGETRFSQSIESVILKSARKNGGITTPSEVALDAGIPIDEAKQQLDTLVSKGFAEIRVKKSGVITYCFPDFLTDSEADEYENI